MTSTIELADRTWELLQHQGQKHGLSTDNAVIHLLLCEHLGYLCNVPTVNERAGRANT